MKNSRKKAQKKVKQLKARMEKEHEKNLHNLNLNASKGYPEEMDFENIVTSVRPAYQKMISWVKSVFKADTEKTTTTLAIQEIKEREEEFRLSIIEVSKSVENKKIDRDRIQLSFPWKWRTVMLVMAGILIFAQIVIDEGAFRSAGFGWFASIFFSILLVGTSVKVASMIPKRIKKFNNKWLILLLWSLTFIIIFLVYYYVGELRVSELIAKTFSIADTDKDTTHVLFNAWAFSALNTFFFFGMTLFLPKLIPSKKQRLAKEKWDKENSELIELTEQLNEMTIQKKALRSSRTYKANESLLHSQECLDSYELADNLFQEALALFKGEFMLKHGYAMQGFDRSIPGLKYDHPYRVADRFHSSINNS